MGSDDMVTLSLRVGARQLLPVRAMVEGRGWATAYGGGAEISVMSSQQAAESHVDS